MREALGGLAVAALAVACCAAIPLLIAGAGSLAIGILLGVAAGIVVLMMLVTAVLLVPRRRRRPSGPSPQAGGSSAGVGSSPRD